MQWAELVIHILTSGEIFVLKYNKSKASILSRREHTSTLMVFPEMCAQQRW